MGAHPGTDLPDSGAGVLAWDERHRARGATGSVDPTVRGAVLGRRPGDAVDLACGTGRHARWLAALGRRTTGVDSSPVGLEVAEAAARDEGLDVAWRLADARLWSPAQPVDLVVVAFVHLPDVVARTATWLAPGGRLVVVGHALANASRGVGGPRDARLLHDPSAAAAAARAAGLRVRRWGEVERPVDLGDVRGVQVDAVLVADRLG